MEETHNESVETYNVVVNAEGQYSIWVDWKTMPDGWSYGGHTGSKDECLNYIKQTWKDLRPLSLQRQMSA